MTKNRVSVSQLSLLLLMVITGGKFLSLPSILVGDVGHDSWLVVSVAFLWDAVCLCFLLWAIKLNDGLTFNTVLNKSLAKVGSTLVQLVFFVMFMCRIIVLMDSCYNTFAVIFDVNTNWIVFTLPIAALALFSVHRGFNAVARAGQILFALIIIAILALLIYPLTQAKFAQLLPVGEVGANKIISTAFLRSFWFSDYVFVYFVMGNIDKKKNLFVPMLTTFAVGALLTILFNAVFVALFGSLAAHNNIAMSKIGLFSVSATTDGRWDWLTLTVWLSSVIIKIVIFTYCAYTAIQNIFNLPLQKLNPIVSVVIVAIMFVPMFVSMQQFFQFVKWCLIPFALVQYLLPLAMPLLTKVASAKISKVQLMQKAVEYE